MAETFFTVYREELLRSVAKSPAEYALRADESPEGYATRTADKMIAIMRAARGVGDCHTESASFRRTCKRLGIGYNRKSMSARIAADLDAEPTGTEGQDRKSYSDTQDRDSYTTEEGRATKGRQAMAEPLDFDVIDGGTVWLFTPLTPAAIDHCEEYFPADCPMLGNGYGVEHRYAPDILADLQRRGFATF